MPEELMVTVAPDARTTARIYHAAAAPIGATLILAHGAGAGQDSAFMVAFAAALAARGADVATFDFLYAARRRRLPDRGPALEACYRAAIDAVRAAVQSARRALFIGGKSMGGRIATQVAAADASLPLAGLVLLGYPLHPPGRPDTRRDRHLAAVGRPMLFVQGSRDTFGTPTELAPVLERLSPPPRLHVVAGGDHSFKLAGRQQARAQADAYEVAQRTLAEWMAGLVPPLSSAAAAGTRQPGR
jgi:uncharacterized protein